ncbi:MAG TPA: ABC transporter permease, partial [Methylomirabilota bacterium]|nr:ABC transporter permease [Methylomirabilota bacterium]
MRGAATSNEPPARSAFRPPESAALILCAVAFAAFAPFTPGFASPGNLWSVVVSCLPLLVLATGQTLVLLTAGIDLSITAVVGLSSVVGALIMGGEHGWLRGSPAATPVAVATMLGTGALVGLLNGVSIAWLRMPAFMVTLTSWMFCGGLAVWLAKTAANTDSIYHLPPAFLALGQQTGLAAALAGLATLLAHLLLTRTLLGRWLYAVGHNPRAARVSGVPTGGVTTAAYVLSGLCAAAASILLTARLETGSPNHGQALLLDVIGAAVIGGTSLSGGRGRVLWTVYGVLFLALLGNGLNLLNVSDFLITIVKGAVILVAALLDRWRAR